MLLAGAAAAALLAVPSGCSAQDVVIARANLGADAGNTSVTDAGDAGQNCSKDHSGRWSCPDATAAPPTCTDDGGGGPFCFAAADARAWNPPTEGGAGQPCSNNDDCSPPGGAAFCAKPGCGAQMGECQLRRLDCDNEPDDAGTVCGCDGVDYWNDCLRMRDGVSSSTNGQCSSQFVTCGGPEETPCPEPDALCFIQATEQCNGANGGTCWVLPDGVCSDAGPHNWQSCGDPGLQCVNLCAAIQSRQPHMRAGAACP